MSGVQRTSDPVTTSDLEKIASEAARKAIEEAQRASEGHGGGLGTLRATKTAIHILLDRSGSMGSCHDATILGFNEWLDAQRKEPGEATLSLTQFDDQYEPNFTNVALDQVKPLDRETYQPRGLTALYDAIGKSIGDFEASLTLNPDQVLFVIMTDGLENHSKEWDRAKIFDLIKRKTDIDKWQFVYLGANQDAYAESVKMGGQAFAVSSSATYDSSPVGTRSTWQSLNTATSRYRSAGAAQVASGSSFLTDEEKAKAANKKKK